MHNFIRNRSLSSELCCAGSLLQTGCKIRIIFLSGVDLLIGWTGHVVRVRDSRSAYGFWWENLREGDYLEDLGLGGRIILRWILRK